MTRPIAPRTAATAVLAGVLIVTALLFVWPHVSGAVVNGQAVRAPGSGRGAARHHAPPARDPRACQQNTRSVPLLPEPLVSFQAPYVPGPCDPMHLLPKQAWRIFACVRWREGGDLANQPNGAGMYQFTNRSTWDEFRGSFPEVPSQATALQQDIVAYRAWRTEQFFPWNGDPCLGSVRQYGKWGWY